MVTDRNTAIFYPSTVCNLNCRYCSIDKNPALIKIDQMIEESFKGDYYINFTKEIFPNPAQLTRIETWGGEPTLGWHRMNNLIHQLIEYYPNLSKFFSSTNMVQPFFLKELKDMLAIFGEYESRNFTFYLQLSLDGTEKITDENRGVGVTKKIRQVFRELAAQLNDIVPKNVNFECFFKPTLDIDNIKELQTKEDIINYYKFFEEFYDIFNELNKCSHAIIYPTYPNTATPGAHTKENGKLFANMCRLCREIEAEGNHFKYFHNITPYGYNEVNPIRQISCAGYTCGTCSQVIGLLPNDMISGCHAAFVDLIDNYKSYINEGSYSNKVLDERMFTSGDRNFFCFNKKLLPLREQQVEYYDKQDTTARLVSTKVLIQSLAYAGQIEEKFIDDTLALQGADLLYRSVCNCMNDNKKSTGSLTTPSVGIIRLIFNGAYEYLSEGD